MTPIALPRLVLKRGDDLVLDGAVDGDLTGWTARAQIRALNDSLLAECAVSPLVYDEAEAVTRYTLSVTAAATAVWPPGSAEMDIEYTDREGLVQSTETVPLTLLRDITREPVAP